MNLSRLRLITFDVTDTLLKFRLAPGKQYGEVGAMYGLSCDNAILGEKFKQHWLRMNEEHPNFGRRSGLGWQEWWRAIVAGTFHDAGLRVDEPRLDCIAAHLIRTYETSNCWQQSYGALGLLSYLRHRGVSLGVISNFDPRLEQTLKNMRLRHYFRFVAASYEVGVAKPDADIFRKAIEMADLEGLRAEECLHVGNTAVLDYLGAKNSGWNAALIMDGEGSDCQAFLEKYPYVHSTNLFLNLYELHRFFLGRNKAVEN